MSVDMLPKFQKNQILYFWIQISTLLAWIKFYDRKTHFSLSAKLFVKNLDEIV